MPGIVSVAQQLVFWLLGVVMHVLDNRMRMMMVLVMKRHMDNVLLMLATTEPSSTGQDKDASDEYSTRLGREMKNIILKLPIIVHLVINPHQQ